MKKIKNNCKNCGNVCSRIYCNNICQTTYQYKAYIQRWFDGKEDGYRGKQKYLSKHIRRYLFESNNSSCAECGWSRLNKSTGLVPLQVHHLDGNFQNKQPDNLQLLCPNCHSLTDSFGSLNDNGRRKNNCM